MNTLEPANLASNGILKLSRIDWIMVLLICTLTSVGVLALYSVAGKSFTPWAGPQVVRILVGLAVLLVVALIPLRLWKGLAIPCYIGSLILIVLIEYFGATGKGAQRWLEVGGFRLQPSEFAKISIVLLLALYYDMLPPERVSRPLWVALPAVLISAPAVLVATQPDLGTAALIMCGGGLVMFVAGVSLYYFAAIAVFGAGSIIAVLVSRGQEWQLLQDYQFRRIDTFLNPDLDPFGAGFHITQSKIAIGSGGLNGRGLGQGTQSQLNFLPEKHTDFVFTNLAEEFGLIWCLILIMIYASIIGLCVVNAIRCDHRFGFLLTMGVSGTLFLYLATNLAMVTGLVPVVGVPLPVISYGGSAMIVLMFAFGLIQSVRIHSERF